MPRQFGTELSHNIQRRHELSPAKRGEIYSMFHAGATVDTIKHEMSLPETTVQSTIKNYPHLNNGESKLHMGRPKKSTDRDERRILHLIHADPKMTYKQLQKAAGLDISITSIKHILHKHHICKWRALK